MKGYKIATKSKQRVLKNVHQEMMKILSSEKHYNLTPNDITRLRRKLRAVKLNYDELWAFYNDYLQRSTSTNPSGTFGELVFNCV